MVNEMFPIRHIDKEEFQNAGGMRFWGTPIWFMKSQNSNAQKE